ncbi:MAG: hypothetical protein KAT65_21030 [Methanophagales archaeon]|nr:hypothetical protein [Methanophagales archaeon]
MYLAKRKVIVEVAINDDSVNSIEDLERAILAQNIYIQVAKKYLDSLQDDMIGQVDERKGSKKVHTRMHPSGANQLLAMAKTWVVPIR